MLPAMTETFRPAAPLIGVDSGFAGYIWLPVLSKIAQSVSVRQLVTTVPKFAACSAPFAVPRPRLTVYAGAVIGAPRGIKKPPARGGLEHGEWQ
jgi:hypothetical protein